MACTHQGRGCFGKKELNHGTDPENIGKHHHSQYHITISNANSREAEYEKFVVIQSRTAAAAAHWFFVSALAPLNTIKERRRVLELNTATPRKNERRIIMESRSKYFGLIFWKSESSRDVMWVMGVGGLRVMGYGKIIKVKWNEDRRWDARKRD